MVTRELVEAELERLDADELAKVYRYIKQVEQDNSVSIIEVDVLLAHWDYSEDDEAWAHLWVGK